MAGSLRSSGWGRVSWVLATALAVSGVVPVGSVSGRNTPLETPPPDGALVESVSDDALVESVSGGSVSYGGGGLEAVVPARVLDTREGLGAPDGPVGAGETIVVQVAGRGGVPSVGAGAVVLNVTATGATAASVVTAWPTGAERPTASNLNFVPGDTIPNLVVVKLGQGGTVSLWNAFGDVHLVADVAGWFPEGDGLEPLVPARVLDTRDGTGAPDGPVGEDATIEVQVAGQGGVPATGAGAVVLNLTATQPTAASVVTAWPTGTERPTASNLNFVAGDTIPNLVIVKLGSGGTVSLWNAFGDVHLVADVAGWFPDNEGLEPLVPARVLDTRDGTGAPDGPVGEDATIEVQITGRGGIPTSGVGAVVLNLTATQPTAASVVTAWPTGTERPTASNLNFVAGDTIPNLVIVKLGQGGTVSLWNAFGDVHLVADVAGWFPTGADTDISMELKAGTVLAGSGDIIATTGTSDTGGTVTLAASADLPTVGGHLAIVPHPTVPDGFAGLVTKLNPQSDGTTIATLAPTNLEAMFADLDVSGTFDEDLDTAAATQASRAPLTEGTNILGWDCTGPGGISAASVPTFKLGNIGGTFQFDLLDRSARLEARFTPTVSWKLSASLSAFNCKRELADVPVGAIGPIALSAGGELTISASAGVSTADVGVSWPMTIGFDHRDGETTNLSKVDSNGNGDGNAANVSLSFGAAAFMKAKGFGIFGLKIAAGPKATVTFADSGCLKISAAYTGSLSAVTEVGKGWLGVSWSLKIAEYTIELGTIYEFDLPCADVVYRIIDGGIGFDGVGQTVRDDGSRKETTNQSTDADFRVHAAGEPSSGGPTYAQLDIDAWDHTYSYSNFNLQPGCPGFVTTSDSDLQHDFGTVGTVFHIAVDISPTGDASRPIAVSLAPFEGTEPRFMWEYPMGVRYWDSSRYSTVLATGTSGPVAECGGGSSSFRIGVNERLPLNFRPGNIGGGPAPTIVNAPTTYGAPVCDATACVVRVEGTTTITTQAVDGPSSYDYRMVTPWWVDVEIVRQ